MGNTLYRPGEHLGQCCLLRGWLQAVGMHALQQLACRLRPVEPPGHREEEAERFGSGSVAIV